MALRIERNQASPTARETGPGSSWFHPEASVAGFTVSTESCGISYVTHENRRVNGSGSSRCTNTSKVANDNDADV